MTGPYYTFSLIIMADLSKWVYSTIRICTGKLSHNLLMKLSEPMLTYCHLDLLGHPRWFSGVYDSSRKLLVLLFAVVLETEQGAWHSDVIEFWNCTMESSPWRLSNSSVIYSSRMKFCTLTTQMLYDECIFVLELTLLYLALNSGNTKFALFARSTETNTSALVLLICSAGFPVGSWRSLSIMLSTFTLQCRHNEHKGVSNHQRFDCLLNRLFTRRSKLTSKLRVTGLCEGNSPMAGKFPAQRASNAENVSIWWRHHAAGQRHSDGPQLDPWANCTQPFFV